MIKETDKVEGKGTNNSFSPALAVVSALSVLISAAAKHLLGGLSPNGADALRDLLFSLAFYGAVSLLPSVILFVFLKKGEGAEKTKENVEHCPGKCDKLLFLTALSAPMFAGMVSFLFGAEGNLSKMSFGGFWDIIIGSFTWVVIPGICEELFYRCALTRTVTAFGGKVLGVVIPALIFGVGHFSSGVIPQALFTGVCYGLLSDGGKRWKMCALCHMINNGCAYLMSVAQAEELTVLAQAVGTAGAVIGISFIPISLVYVLRKK